MFLIFLPDVILDPLLAFRKELKGMSEEVYLLNSLSSFLK